MAPGGPTAVSATSGDMQATIAFSPPAMLGTQPLSYLATSSPGALTAIGASSPLIVTGLTNGTSYTFTVTAFNSFGATQSSSSSSIVPAGVPGTPAAPTVTAGNGQATLSWTAPSNNGSAIVDYIIYYATSLGGTYAEFGDGVGVSTSTTVGGLTNGTAYFFKIVAQNAIGNSAQSAASEPVTPVAPPVVPVVPPVVPVVPPVVPEAPIVPPIVPVVPPPVDPCAGAPAIDTIYYGTNCNGTTLQYVWNDGCYGQYARFTTPLSESCGYVPPVAPVAPPVTPTCDCCKGTFQTQYRCISTPGGCRQQSRTNIVFTGVGGIKGSGSACTGSCAGGGCSAYTQYGTYANTGASCSPC